MKVPRYRKRSTWPRRKERILLSMCFGSIILGLSSSLVTFTPDHPPPPLASWWRINLTGDHDVTAPPDPRHVEPHKQTCCAGLKCITLDLCWWKRSEWWCNRGGGGGGGGLIHPHLLSAAVYRQWDVRRKQRTHSDSGAEIVDVWCVFVLLTPPPPPPCTAATHGPPGGGCLGGSLTCCLQLTASG